MASAIIVYALGPWLLADLGVDGRTAALFVWLFGVAVASSFAVVRHAEVLAHRYGEPAGTLILTLSAVSIEVIMISAMMLHAGDNPTLARDTIYSTLMIIINGLIGVAMLVGGIRFGEQEYNLKSSTSFFSMILVLVGVGLYLPGFVPTRFVDSYEVFLIVLTSLLYILFLRIQTTEHRYFFVSQRSARSAAAEHVGPEAGPAWLEAGLLLATLGVLAYLAESLAGIIDTGVDVLGFPQQLGSLIVALLVLSPEGLAAIRAGLGNDMQRVVNIGLGSALSTLSLTIPVILVVGLATGRPVDLGLNHVQATILAFTLLIGMNNYRSGETNLLQGAIHFALFATFVVLIFA